VRMDLPIREIDEVLTTTETNAGDGARHESKTPEAAE
jgi:hypothetical protein